ncbi:MAG: STAS domain-containing protein [Clostridia bacterium]|nr:STAS domain-containing protein [Clostridia bacterium]
MEITKNREGNKLTFALDGRLDTITSQQLEKELRTSIDGVAELVFDFENLSYITSAGLRVLSVAQKVMNRQGRMKIIHTQPDVMEVFDVTGLTDIMEIE